MSQTRTIWIPNTVKWIERFNKRFSIKKNWKGTFSSRLGFGHCIFNSNGLIGYSFNLN
jgi:hypothetical protein